MMAAQLSLAGQNLSAIPGQVGEKQVLALSKDRKTKI
jgi:hypothetical protein